MCIVLRRKMRRNRKKKNTAENSQDNPLQWSIKQKVVVIVSHIIQSLCYNHVSLLLEKTSRAISMGLGNWQVRKKTEVIESKKDLYTYKKNCNRHKQFNSAISCFCDKNASKQTKIERCCMKIYGNFSNTKLRNLNYFIQSSVSGLCWCLQTFKSTWVAKKGKNLINDSLLIDKN